jgi:hypothetical protein
MSQEPIAQTQCFRSGFSGGTLIALWRRRRQRRQRRRLIPYYEIDDNHVSVGFQSFLGNPNAPAV